MSLKDVSYFMKNAESFNTLTTINMIIRPGYAAKKRNVKYVRHLIIIIKTTIFKTNP